MEPHDSALGQPLRMAAHALDWGDSFNSQINRYKGSGRNEKLLRHRVPKVGIVRIVPSTPTQKSHKHRQHGGAVFPSYGIYRYARSDAGNLFGRGPARAR
jgi:hypothetical protein